LGYSINNFFQEFKYRGYQFRVINRKIEEGREEYKNGLFTVIPQRDARLVYKQKKNAVARLVRQGQQGSAVEGDRASFPRMNPSLYFSVEISEVNRTNI